MGKKYVIELEEEMIVREKSQDEKDKERRNIKILYGLGIFVWLALIIFNKFYKSTFWGIFVLSFPIIVFISNMTTLTDNEEPLGQDILQSNILTFAFIASAAFSNWKNPKRPFVTWGRFLHNIVISLVFLMISMLDVWISPDTRIMARHTKTIFHTISLTVLTYAVVDHYIDNFYDNKR